MTTEDIYTGNVCMVGQMGGNVMIMFPRQVMTKEEALAHAAWLVLMANDLDAEEFAKVFKAVCNT